MNQAPKPSFQIPSHANVPTASIIVPIYNAERTLHQCLDSLAVQKGVQLEFICIDDGSVDGSLSLLHSYEMRDERFKVIAKQNEGYGATINQGIAQAKGDYVGIMEADDAVGEGCYEKLLAIAADYDMPDIVKANYYRVMDGQECFVENYPAEVCSRLIADDDAAWDKLIVSTPAVWAALYRRDFLQQNEITCLETQGASYQDTGFVMKSWIAAERVVVDYNGYYRYTTLGEGSSSISGGNPNAVMVEWASIDRFSCANEKRIVRRDQLMSALAVKRFQTYWWNLRRIKPDLKRAFADDARVELMALDSLNVWENAKLTDAERLALEKWLLDSRMVLPDFDEQSTKEKRVSSMEQFRHAYRNAISSIRDHLIKK